MKIWNYLLEGFIYVILTTNSSYGEINCTITDIGEMYSVNCSRLGWLEIPQNLSDNIQILVLSRNKIRNLTNDSFFKYKSLLELYLNHNNLYTIQAGTFIPLMKLKILDLSDINYHRPFIHYWPQSLEILLINNNLIGNNLILTDLKNLKTLHASNCSLAEFPRVNTDSSVHLNLELNPLNNIAIVDLMPLIHLKQLDLQWPEDSTINSTKDWCTCIKIKHLLSKRKVKSSDLNCSKSGIESLLCEVVMDTIPDKLLEYACNSAIEILLPLTIITVMFFIYLVRIIYLSVKRRLNGQNDILNLEEESPL